MDVYKQVTGILKFMSWKCESLEKWWSVLMHLLKEFTTEKLAKMDCKVN